MCIGTFKYCGITLIITNWWVDGWDGIFIDGPNAGSKIHIHCKDPILHELVLIYKIDKTKQNYPELFI